MPFPTPGQYLHAARLAAGLGLEDLALFTETTPPVSAHRRAEWLHDIESGAAPVPPGLGAALAPFLNVSVDELDELIAAHTGAAVWRGADVLIAKNVSPFKQSAAA